LLADLKGETPSVTVTEVQDRVTKLIASVEHGANVDRGSAPQGMAPQQVVAYDSTAPVSVTTELERATGEQLTAWRSSLSGLRAIVADDELEVPLPQAAAVLRFHRTYPPVWQRLTAAKVRVKFNVRTSDGRGGGLFDNNTIYLSKLPTTPSGAFVRLLVHEIGHALFETALLDHRTMPHELVADKLADLRKPVESSALWDRGQDCQRIQRFWDAMSDPAKTFYQAWLTLRQNDGARLLGVDLWTDPNGNRLDPEQRRKYQAQNFGEFCAEVFMLYAIGDLRAHVTAVLANGGAPLETVAGQILGPRVAL
jgi:hypothetical protein